MAFLGFFIIDPLYLLIMAPAMIFALWAQTRTSRAFARWSQVSNRVGLTGEQVASRLWTTFGQQAWAARGGAQLPVGRIGGTLSDHYDPHHKAINLSDDVFSKATVASAAVAAHELGHAMQDAEGYGPMRFRQAFYPAAALASKAWVWLFLVAFFLPHLRGPLMLAAIVCLSLYAVFALVTLPVELDASKRALAMLESGHVLTGEELDGGRQVLNAAALTYVASATQAVMMVIYMLMSRR